MTAKPGWTESRLCRRGCAGLVCLWLRHGLQGLLAQRSRHLRAEGPLSRPTSRTGTRPHRKSLGCAALAGAGIPKPESADHASPMSANERQPIRRHRPIPRLHTLTPAAIEQWRGVASLRSGLRNLRHAERQPQQCHPDSRTCRATITLPAATLRTTKRPAGGTT